MGYPLSFYESVKRNKQTNKNRLFKVWIPKSCCKKDDKKVVTFTVYKIYLFRKEIYMQEKSPVLINCDKKVATYSLYVYKICLAKEIYV